MKPVDVKSNTYINSIVKKLMLKILNLKLLILLEYQNIKLFLQKVTLQIDEAFVMKKVKNTVPWTYVISDSNREEIVGMLYEKELQKTKKVYKSLKKFFKKFRVDKVIKREGDKLFLKWKAVIICLIAG